MQATSPSAPPGVGQSLEVRPVHVERIDPAVLQFICFLFPCQFEGMKFLALLCRRATEKQLAFYREPVAVVTFHGIAALCAEPDWPWGYHATLRYFIIFEALGILTRSRRNRITEVHIPLGMREEPLIREQLLQSLGDLQKKKPKKREYKDKKLVQLIERVKKHIEVYGLGASGDSEKKPLPQFDPTLLDTVQERLIEAMRSEHIPVAKCKRIAQWVYTHEVPQLLQAQMSADQLFAGGRFSIQPGDSQLVGQERTGRYQCTLGDSERDNAHPHTKPQGDFQDTVGDSQHGPDFLEQGDKQAQTAQNRPQNHQPNTHSDISTLTEQAESPIFVPAATSHHRMGDSEACLSSNISILCNNISDKDRNDIEKAPEVASSPLPRSEESILEEATWIAVELDGEESLKLNRGRGWIGAYKKKLEEKPYLVRASMIDMFMQRFFPDWQGPPQGRGGRWFNIAYKAYALEEKPVPADIESWARSPYSYKQIKKALFLERQRQEEEIKEIARRNPFSTETFQRPFADCVEIYGLLRGGQAGTPASEVYHDPFPDRGSPAMPPEEQSDDDLEQGAVIEMEDGSRLTREEYEQLEKRAFEEESRRVKALIADPSLSDQLREYVEQWVAAGLSSLPAPVLDDLQHLRAILDPECYTVDVQFAAANSYAIKVQSLDDPTNVCLLADPEQAQTFLRRFGQIPDPLHQNLQHLWAILDPELYVAEVLLTLDGPYTISVRARTNPNNACLLKGLGQIKAFLAWLTHLPAAVLDDIQQLRAILNPELYTVGVRLAPASRYVILVWANDDPMNERPLEGPMQTQEFIRWFTQEETTDPASSEEV